MRRILGLFLTVVAAVAVGIAAQANPIPDPNFARTILPLPCTAETEYERDLYRAEGWSSSNRYTRYGSDCQRLKFTYGPILIKPGQNDIFISPMSIEKPAYDGYIVRFKPDMVRADGSIPPIEEMHLHHAVWLSLPRNYGSGQPFFASGEEKTIFDFPRPYGMEVLASDTWQLNYMIHNQTPRPAVVWITYDIDYIPRAAAEQQHNIKRVYPIWLDVRPSFYPVFNVQRKYGREDSTGQMVCTWPKEKCADLDPWGGTTVGQGESGNGTGTHFSFPGAGGNLGRLSGFQGGTLVGIGGHLHPGGLTVDIDLQRGPDRTRIFTSEANYWDWDDPSQAGGPPTSWDLSMTVTGLPYWGVEVRPDDKIWINATYDAEIQSTFENMGIAMAWITPHALGAGPGINPFTATKDTSAGCTSGGLAADSPTLCDRGFVTHGHMEEASNHGGASGSLTVGQGPVVSQITIADFYYLPGSHGLAQTTGVPGVTLGQTLRFVNADAGANIYHSITSCEYPCTGATGIAFPLGNGVSSLGNNVDFDSGQLGYGIPSFTPAKNTSVWNLPVTSANGFEAGATYSYFCRVHPFMRGAFSVR